MSSIIRLDYRPKQMPDRANNWLNWGQRKDTPEDIRLYSEIMHCGGRKHLEFRLTRVTTTESVITVQPPDNGIRYMLQKQSRDEINPRWQNCDAGFLYGSEADALHELNDRSYSGCNYRIVKVEPLP